MRTSVHWHEQYTFSSTLPSPPPGACSVDDDVDAEVDDAEAELAGGGDSGFGCRDFFADALLSHFASTSKPAKRHKSRREEKRTEENRRE